MTKPNIPPDAEFRQTAGNAGMIGLTAFLGAIVGFLLQLLVAYYFGAGNQTDAYFMAQSTSELLLKILMGGSITAVFIPLFVERLTQGNRQSAWQTALNIFHLTGALYLAAGILIAVFAEPFIRFVAPGFDEGTFHLTVTLLRVLLPSFLFLFLVELATSMLHALKIFSLPALLRVVAPLISIVAILLFVNRLGIFALAAGSLAGSIIQFTILVYGLHKQGLSYRFVFQPADATIKKLIWLVYPFVFSILMTQAAGIIYRILVSDLSAGSLASLKFAEKITQLITIMFLNSVTMVIYPLLSAKASRRDLAGVQHTMASAIRLIFFTTLPIVIAVALLREPFISLVYQRGSFTPEDARLTSIALLWLVIGLITNGISSVFGHTVLAIQHTRAAVAITIASQAIAAFLFLLLVPVMAHAGLALASSLVPLAITLLYFLHLSKYIPGLMRVFWHRTYAQTLFLGLVLAAVIILLRPIAQALPVPSKLSALLQVLIPAVIGSAVYFGASFIWGIREMHEVVGMLKEKFLKYSARV